MPTFDQRGPALGVMTFNSNSLAVSATESGAGAGVTATLPNVANQWTVITGFIITSGVPAANHTAAVTVSLGGTTLTFQYNETTTFGGQLIVQFSNPIPATAVNTAIVVTMPAVASGAITTIDVFGFQTP